MGQKYRKREAASFVIEGLPYPTPSNDLAECTGCKRTFPAHLVTPMAIGPPLRYVNVCPICGLEVSNERSDLKRKKFDGPIAESMRQEALAWLKREPKNMKHYRFKYSVEGPGSFPKPTEGERPIPGIFVTDKPYGLADELLVVSIVGHGEKRNYAIFTTEAGGGFPSRALLMDLREKIDHYLESHVREPK